MLIFQPFQSFFNLYMLQLIFVFPLFLGMVMYMLMNLPSKEKQKLTEIKNYLQHISSPLHRVRLIHYCYRVTFL